MNDILDDKTLKRMPFSTPEGYFDRLKTDKQVRQQAPVHEWGRFTPYLVLAAMFAALVAAGGFFLEKTAAEEFSQEDYLVFSEDMTNIIFYDSDEQYADAVTEEDIIEYLIYTGVEIEELY